jgi:hypothetical protein
MLSGRRLPRPSLVWPAMVEDAKNPPAAARPDGDRRRSQRIAAVLALIVALIVVLLLVDGGSDGDPSGDGAARIVTVDALREAAGEGTVPVYWAGPQAGAEIELSQPDASRTYVRYLTGGAEAGDPSGGFLTIATYAHADPVGALRRQGEEPGGVLATAPGEATVYFSRNQPRSVYLAYPGVDVQIEVYDPDFKRALQLVESGQIVSAG